LRRVRIEGECVSQEPVNAVEIILNGKIVERLAPNVAPGESNSKVDRQANRTKFRHTLELDGSSWIAVRCWEPRNGGRIRFAHSAPWFFDVPGAPLPPRREEVGFLIRSVQRELERSSAILPAEAVAEYQKALSIYEDIARRAQ
jgi:hypothetical protein